jgi:hypothetical protein
MSDGVRNQSGANARTASTAERAIEFVHDVLDHEIVDAHQVPCGIVDDIEFEFLPKRGLRPVALLVGPGAWQRRLTPWLASLARLAVGGDEVRIPLLAVAYIDERVALRGTAEELGLGAADRRWARRLAKVRVA